MGNILGIPKMLSIFSLFEKKVCKESRRGNSRSVPTLLPINPFALDYILGGGVHTQNAKRAASTTPFVAVLGASAPQRCAGDRPAVEDRHVGLQTGNLHRHIRHEKHRRVLCRRRSFT